MKSVLFYYILGRKSNKISDILCDMSFRVNSGGGDLLRRFEKIVLKIQAVVNKLPRKAYNIFVIEITVSDDKQHGAYITYLYNRIAESVIAERGSAILRFDDRANLIIKLVRESESVKKTLVREIAEIIGVGYKNKYLEEKLKVSLSKRENKLLRAALIAADCEGDAAFIRRKITPSNEYAIDGIYNFRLARLREKWDKIISYVPVGFSSEDLMHFCEFLVGESKNKIYLRGNVVFGENFAPLRRSRLTGEEDIETEILLSDAGYVYCLGDVSEQLCDFLQKYYAERTIFS